MRSLQFTARLAIGVAALGWAACAAAFSVNIYDFGITRGDGSPVFGDSFTDGLEPPLAPGAASPNFQFFTMMGPPVTNVPPSYLVPAFNHFPDGSEVGGAPGYLQMNTALGITSVAPSTGLLTELQRARLNTNTLTDPTNLAYGLKHTNTFVVTGKFDIINPGPDDKYGYGIALTNPQASIFDFISLRVAGGPAGPLVLLQEVTNAGPTPAATSIASVLLPASGTIELRLSHLTTDTSTDDSRLITAAFRLNGTGSFLELADLTKRAKIFDTVEFTQAEFRAFAPVPEPQTYLLMLAGIVALGFMARRRMHERG